MNSKLVINNIDVEITKELPVSVNFAIADIRELDKRQGSYSKTLVLNGTNNVTKLFEHIFDVNISLGTFNPNKKTTAVYYINEYEQLKGDLQLLKVVRKPSPQLHEYHCNIIGREAGLFFSIGDKFLTDSDYSRFDHTYSKTEQSNSWATSYRLSGVATAFSYGFGYVYPIIKYGTNPSDISYGVEDLKPALAAREYLLQIFTDAGFTWTSSFLDGAFFKRLYVPCNRDKLSITAAQVQGSQHYVGVNNEVYTTIVSSNTYTANGDFKFTKAKANVPYTTESGGFFFDPSNQYNNTSGVVGGVPGFTSKIINTGWYTVASLLSGVQYTVKCGGVYPVGKFKLTAVSTNLYIEVSYDNGSTWATQAFQFDNNVPTSPTLTAYGAYSGTGTAGALGFSAQTSSMYLPATTLVRTSWDVQVFGKAYQDPSGAIPVPNGTAVTLDCLFDASFFSSTQTYNEHWVIRNDTTLGDNGPLSFNSSIPLNIKQKDFVKSIFQAFNLYAELSKTKDNDYIIEPRDSFFTNNVIDWTSKVDYSKDWEMIPMGDLDFRNYVSKYKDDKDYYNDDYQKNFIDNYGLKRVQVDNDFIRSEKTIELIFSPTPNVGNTSNKIICPHIYQKDGVNIKPSQHNIRLLYYGGLKNSAGTWTHASPVSGNTNHTTYPYMGHCDDPVNPTIDLNFWYPKRVYYDYILASFTSNNLYNAYYARMISEITDKDSKIIKCWVRLNESDIYDFTFRKKIYIRGPEGSAYYIVNKIIDYSPIDYRSTQVELLKLKDYATPSLVDNILIAGNDTELITSANSNRTGNSSSTNSLVTGSRNICRSQSSFISGGTDNLISDFASESVLINCTRCTITDGSNIVAIGLTDQVLDSSYNGQMLNGDTVGNTKVKSLTQTASFNIDKNVSIYYIDCTSGDITATFDFTVDSDRTITFIRTDSTANIFRIDEVGGVASLQGTHVPIDLGMAQWDSLPINNNGTDFFIV